MRAEDKIRAYDWAIQKVTNVQGKVDELEGTLLQVKAALQINAGNDAAAGKVIRELLLPEKETR